jgi:hypothetical protein
MTKKDDRRKKKSAVPWYKDKSNIAMMILTAGLLAFMALWEGEDGYTPLERLFYRGRDLVQETTQGCKKPPDSEVEAHFRDDHGSKPVERGFDAPEGALCGNGQTYYCTAVPPKKPIPVGWDPPPLPGTDPDWKGSEPGAPFKESPYAMPSPKVVRDRKPIRDLGDPRLAEELTERIEDATGEIGFLGDRGVPGTFDSFRDELVRLEPGEFDTEDEAGLARELIERGIEYVLVDRTTPPVKPWIEEEMSRMRLRLRDAVELDWFHAAVLGSGWALFRLAAPFELPSADKRRISKRIRALLTGREPEEYRPQLPTEPVGDPAHRVIVSLRNYDEPRLKGRKLAKRMAHDRNLIDAIDKAVAEIREDWGDIRRANKRAYGFEVDSDLPRAMKSLEIEVDILYDICSLTDREARNLLWYIELGLEGILLRDSEEGLVHFLEPSYAVQMEQRSEVQFLESMLRKNDLDQFLRPPKKVKRSVVLHESEWESDRRYGFQRFRTINWVERPQSEGGDIAELYRAVPLKAIWDVSRASLVRSLSLGADWLLENQSKDGQYAYKYKPVNKPGKRWYPGGNIVRHALNPYTLLMVNKIDPRPEYVESAKKGIEFTLDFLRREGDRCVICHRDPPARFYNAKLGTNAVTILSILKLGDVADISEYEDVLRCLTQELIYMQDPNGHYWQYDVPRNHPYYGAESFIAPGEFVFALARMYSHFGDEKYKESIDRALPWYMKAWRKLLSERTPEGIYDEEHRVNLIGIVPWLVTAMNDLHRKTGEQRYADIAFEMQDWIDEEFFWYPRRAQYPDYVGASFKVHRELPAINSCQYTEGAAAAYDLAKRVDRNVESRRKLLVHGMRFCLQLQYDSYGSTFFLPVPEEAMGGYRYTLGHLRLRNDYSYHAMAAIAQAVEYLEPDDYPSQRPMRLPPVMHELLGGRPNPEKDAPRGWKPPAATPAADAGVDAGAAADAGVGP